MFVLDWLTELLGPVLTNVIGFSLSITILLKAYNLLQKVQLAHAKIKDINKKNDEEEDNKNTGILSSDGKNFLKSVIYDVNNSMAGSLSPDQEGLVKLTDSSLMDSLLNDIKRAVLFIVYFIKEFNKQSTTLGKLLIYSLCISPLVYAYESTYSADYFISSLFISFQLGVIGFFLLEMGIDKLTSKKQ